METNSQLALTETNKIALPLNPEERALVDQWMQKKKEGTLPIDIRSEDSESGATTVFFDPKSPRGTVKERIALNEVVLSSATGASSPSVATALLQTCFVSSGLMKASNTSEDNAQVSKMIMEAMTAFKPQDETEGMLISRLIGLHFQTMNSMGVSGDSRNSAEAIDRAVNRAAKFSRLYNETLDTLMRYRRKGAQQVIVQHVQVNDGGKAVVGGTVVAGGGN